MEWNGNAFSFFQSCSFQRTSKFNHKHNGTNKSKVLNTNGPSISYVGHLDSVTFLFSSFKAAFAQRNFHPLFPVKVAKASSVPVLSSGAQLCSLNFHFLFEVLQKLHQTLPQRCDIKRTGKNDENKTEWDDDFQKGNLFTSLIFFQVLGSMFFIGVRWSKYQYICKNNSIPPSQGAYANLFACWGARKSLFSQKRITLSRVQFGVSYQISGHARKQTLTNCGALPSVRISMAFFRSKSLIFRWWSANFETTEDSRCC